MNNVVSDFFGGKCLFLSSPEPLGSQGELIVYLFYVEPPWDGGTKLYINGHGRMTKIAATPIYGKNL